MRAPQYLYVCETFPIRVSGVVEGRTVTAVFSAQREGAEPPAIGDLSITLDDLDDGEHGADVSRDDLGGAINTAGLMRRAVYLHIDDGVDWHDVWPLVPTDIDPDLLPPLRA